MSSAIFPDVVPGIQNGTEPVNYAKQLLIKSFPWAIGLSFIYFLLLVIYIFKAVRNSTYVLWIIAFFCQVRVVAFAMRALLTKRETAGENFHFVLAQQIIYGIGFFGVLYSAYIMVIDRQIIKRTTQASPLARITENLHLIRLALIAAVSLSITGVIMLNTGSTTNTVTTGKHLRAASAIIFVLIAILLVLQTVFASVAESRRIPDEKDHDSLASFGLYVLLFCGLLLLVREFFMLGTNGNILQYKERLFYPFAACTELLVVLFFLLPGITPQKHELAEAKENS